MKRFTSTKLFDGYSTCFRQWRAEGTHCKFLHGYAISFRVWFEGDLDERHWVFDFGGMKRAKTTILGMSPKDYFAWLLDHTTIVAEDDPQLQKFKELDSLGVIQLRIMPTVGCERFAEFLYGIINAFLSEETKGRVKATKIEVYEHERNSASYTEDDAKQQSPAAAEVEMVSLFDYLGRPAGGPLGMQVYNESKKLGITVGSVTIVSKNYSGKVILYPKTFLNDYFHKELYGNNDVPTNYHIIDQDIEEDYDLPF